MVGALGFAAKLLSPQHLDEQLPKLVPSILQLYRKHSEHYVLSQVFVHTHTRTTNTSSSSSDLALIRA